MTMRKAKPSSEQIERQERWQEGMGRRSLTGRRLWRCWHCDSLEPWSPEHGGYWSIKEEEDGLPLPIFCSETCRLGMVVAGLLPKTSAA